jgi:ureidoglycolate hydrolase
MHSDSITVRGREESGYGVCIDSAESWIVAVNNAGPSSDPNGATFLGSHPNTDETFILVRGKGCLTYAPHELPEDFTVILMAQGVCYNVRRNTWHAVLMAPGAKVAICENRNPEGERHDLSDEGRKRLAREAGALLKKVRL